MNKTKLIPILVLFLLIINLVAADIDYNNPDLYQNQDFLQTSDPSKWNIELIDWTNKETWYNEDIDKLFQRPELYEIEELYSIDEFYYFLPPDTKIKWEKVDEEHISKIKAESLDYEQLSKEQRLKMQAHQIQEHFDNIDDLTKDVESMEVFIAMEEKYGAIVDLGEGARIRDGVLYSTYGNKGRLTLPDDNSKKIGIVVDEKGDILLSLIPEESVLPLISDEWFKSFTISDQDNVKIIIEGHKAVIEDYRSEVTFENFQKLANEIRYYEKTLPVLNIVDKNGNIRKIHVPENIEIKDGIVSVGESHVDLSHDYYNNGILRSTSDGLLFYPDDEVTKIDLPPSTDSLLITSALFDKISFTETKRSLDLKVSDGHEISFKGTIDSRKDGLFAEYCTINNIQLAFGDGVKLFFDGKEHHDDKISTFSLSKDGKTLFVNENQGTHSVYLKPGNSLIDVKPDNDIHFSLKDASLKITNRQDQDLIAKVEITGKKEYFHVGVKNSNMQFYATKSAITYPCQRTDENKVPSRFSLEINNLVGSPLAKDDKYLFSERGFTVISRKEKSGKTSFSYQHDIAPTTISEVLNFYDLEPESLFGQENIIKNPGLMSRKEVKKITEKNPDHLLIAGLTEPGIVRRLYDTLEVLENEITGPELVESANGFIIYTESEWEAQDDDILAEAGGWASLSDGVIRLREDNMDVSTIAHELGHTMIPSIEAKEEKDKSEAKYIMKNKEYYGPAMIEYAQNILNKKTFKQKWLDIAGDVYDKTKEIKRGGRKFGVSTWKDAPDIGSDDQKYGPRHGCVRAYGCKNYLEDVSTFLENLYSKAYSYKELIDPNSEFYKNKPQQTAQDWANRYRKKLDMLHEYNFIKKERYELITKKPT